MVNSPSPVAPNPNGDQQSMDKLKQSFVYIAGVIGLALAGYFGWTYLQGSKANVDTVAADKYVAIEQARDAINLAQDSQTPMDSEASQKLKADIDVLVAKHGSTIYAWEALMLKARIATDANDFETAKQALNTALTIELNDAGLRAITQLRYAATLLFAKDIDGALAQASVQLPSAFEGSQQELLGDIYVAKQDKQSAIRSYENAWGLLSKRSEERGVLRLKLEGLGINPAPIEPEPQIINQTASSVAANVAADSEGIVSDTTIATAQESEAKEAAVDSDKNVIEVDTVNENSDLTSIDNGTINETNSDTTSTN